MELNVNSFNIWLGRIEIIKSVHNKNQVIYNRLMNAGQIMFLTKNHTIFILFRMPNLFNQDRDSYGFLTDIPTRYNRFWIQLRRFKQRIYK